MPHLTGIILNSAQNGKHMGMASIDLQKAFVTLDHKLSLDKMKCIGFPDKTIKWFYSYVKNRVLSVSLGTVFLEAGTINYGFSQGSIFGTLLFLLYINDIPQSLSNTQIELANVCDRFVDDKLSIYFSEDTIFRCILFSRDNIHNITYVNSRMKQW